MGDDFGSSGRSVDSGPGNPPSCIIVIYPNLGVDGYKFVIAHEFFHCMQDEDFELQSYSSGADWWLEGTAEWFASRVERGTNYSDGWVDGFDELSAETPLTGMTYENVVFFWWLDQNFGPGRVIDLIRAMPTRDTSQDEALAGVLSDAEFLQFVEDYLDRKITQPGGRTAAVTPAQGHVYNVERDQTITIEAERFVTYRAILEFACGEWSAKVTREKGAYQTQRQPDLNWSELPAVFRSDSTGDIRFRVAGGAAQEGGLAIEIEAAKTPCIPCLTPDFSDGPEACLVGEWHLASGGMGAKIGKMLEDVPEIEGVDYPDIDGFLALRRDGTFTLRANDDGSLSATSPSGGLFSADISIKMEKQGTWSISGNKLIQCYTPLRNIKIDETVTDPDGVKQTITGNRFLGPAVSYTEKRQFTCADGKLNLVQRALLAPTITWEYEK